MIKGKRGEDMEEKKTIKEIRTAQGIQASYLAKIIGITPSSFSCKENGKREWKAKEIAIICELLNTDIRNIRL